MDEQEAVLQSKTTGLCKSDKGKPGRFHLSRTGASLDEGVFVAQLALRAKLLNDEFQDKVVQIVEKQGKSVGAERRKSATIEATTNRVVSFLCDLGDTLGRVEVHTAQPKSDARMKAKLHKYAHPHPRAEWPLCANILDPIRASIVCCGPRQVLRVLSWLLEQQDPAGLKICRVKNKFAFSAPHAGDGYRDLQICVLFKGSSGLSIIGEIQIHDAELFDLKQKVSLGNEC